MMLAPFTFTSRSPNVLQNSDASVEDSTKYAEQCLLKMKIL